LEAIAQREKYELLKNKVQEKQALLTIDLQKMKAGKGGVKLFLTGKSKEEEMNIIDKHIQEVNFF